MPRAVEYRGERQEYKEAQLVLAGAQSKPVAECKEPSPRCWGSPVEAPSQARAVGSLRSEDQQVEAYRVPVRG